MPAYRSTGQRALSMVDFALKSAIQLIQQHQLAAWVMHVGRRKDFIKERLTRLLIRVYVLRIGWFYQPVKPLFCAGVVCVPCCIAFPYNFILANPVVDLKSRTIKYESVSLESLESLDIELQASSSRVQTKVNFERPELRVGTHLLYHMMRPTAFAMSIEPSRYCDASS